MLVFALFFFQVACAEETVTDKTATEETVTTVSPTTEAGEGLDLYAASELFAQSESVEAFEDALNDSATGINNLDLDEDGHVDYIRAEEHVDGETHVVVLQVELAEDDAQDVASIEVETVEGSGEGEDAECNVQAHGNEEIYGADYYVAPTTTVYVRTYPVVRLMFGPRYKPWRSPWRWGHYPKRWRRRPILSLTVYRSRTSRWTKNARFVHTKRSRVRGASKVYPKPRTSTRAVRKSKPVKAPAQATPAKATPGKAAPGKATPGKTSPGKTQQQKPDSKGGSKTQPKGGSQPGGRPGGKGGK